MDGWIDALVEFISVYKKCFPIVLVSISGNRPGTAQATAMLLARRVKGQAARETHQHRSCSLREVEYIPVAFVKKR